MLRNQLYRLNAVVNPRLLGKRSFHNSNFLFKIKPFLLADIGEGIKECEVIQWFVQPGARIEEFDPICEVQSDKASVEITSRYTGVIKALHYDVGQMALVGKPLIDIDVEDGSSEPSNEPEPAVGNAESASAASSEPAPSSSSAASSGEPVQQTGKYATLATPAVRRISKELNIDISFVKGTGKDGRVLKEDVLAFHASGGKTPTSSSSTSNTQSTTSQPQKQPQQPLLEETIVPLTPIQNQMFKTMTNSLNIPHFLYTEEVGIDSLTQTRKKINSLLAKKAFGPDLPTKISYMPLFIKALSLALTEYPIVNARVTFDAQTSKPQIVMRPSHNIGIAMDTPSGLVVPNIKNVERLSILEIASELSRLQQLGAANKFGSQDLQGGTVSLSNIGNVGGTYLGPVIVDSQVAIVGIGRARTIPSFAVDESTGAADFGKVVPKQVINTSWSGDHRVLDGMTMAKMADRFKEYLESPELMMLNLK